MKSQALTEAIGAVQTAITRSATGITGAHRAIERSDTAGRPVRALERAALVLVVEDEVSIAHAVASFAREEGLRPIVVHTFDAAFDVLSREDVRSVVVDWKAPKNSDSPSLTTARLLVERIRVDNIECVVYTGYPDDIPPEIVKHTPVIEKPGLDELRQWLRKTS